MKKPSAETQLVRAKREIEDLRKLVESIRVAKDGYRDRATAAEAEVAEWKWRFDLALKAFAAEKATKP